MSENLLPDVTENLLPDVIAMKLGLEWLASRFPPHPVGAPRRLDLSHQGRGEC